MTIEPGKIIATINNNYSNKKHKHSNSNNNNLYIYVQLKRENEREREHRIYRIAYIEKEPMNRVMGKIRWMGRIHHGN